MKFLKLKPYYILYVISKSWNNNLPLYELLSKVNLSLVQGFLILFIVPFCLGKGNDQVLNFLFLKEDMLVLNIDEPYWYSLKASAVEGFTC